MTEQMDHLKAALADRYIIERQLGRGGYAVVYLAHDRKHDRLVAVKVLRAEVAESLGLERFLREIRVTAQLNHPHILPLLDSGEKDGFLYYVMPYVEGETLRQKLAREKQLSVEEAVSISREVADALDYAHQHGVIHRDVKPENILLQAGRPIVADFGIALAAQQAARPRLTGTGLSLGTPEYMSPEQADGTQQLDARSDLYSLGCVLYEMLAGEPPYTGSSLRAIVAKQMVQTVPSIRVLRDTVPPALDALVQRALAKSPADRFATASSFSAALTHATEPRPRRVKGLVAFGAVVVAAAGILALLRFPTVGNEETSEAAGDAPLAVQVGVFPVVVLNGNAATSSQAERIQYLFASELARYRGLEVVDPLALKNRAATGTTDTVVEGRSGPGSLGLKYAVRITATHTPRSLEVAYSLTDAAEGHIVEAGTFSSTSEAALPTQIRQASGRLAVALEAATGGLAKGLDVEPFLTQESNPAAVQAFLQGIEYSYRFIPGGSEYFRRALELAPDFIAPRVFLVSGLLESSDTAAAVAHVEVLQSLKSTATPFEQETIGWAEAAIRGDLEGEIRHIRVSLAYAPHNNIALFTLALNLWAVGRPREAIEPAREAMESGWRLAPLYALWGELAIAAGDPTGLRDTLEFARTFAPPDPRIEGLLEALALFEADTSGAGQYGASFRGELGPSGIAAGYAEMTSSYRSLARRAREEARPSVAVLLLQRMVDAGVRSPILQLELARTLAETGDRHGAESHYLTVAGSDLDDPEVLNVAGAVAELLGRAEDARHHFSKYLEVAPNGPDAIRIRERLRALGRSGPS